MRLSAAARSADRADCLSTLGLGEGEGEGEGEGKGECEGEGEGYGLVFGLSTCSGSAYMSCSCWDACRDSTWLGSGSRSG